MTTQDMERLPGWGISSMLGPTPRHHKHERRHTPFTHPFIQTRWIWKDDYDGQMIFGDLGGPKASRHLSYRWGKNLTQETCPDRGSNSGPLRDRLACYHLVHSGGPLLPEFAVEVLPSAELQHWFLRLQWRTCPWAEHYDDENKLTFWIAS